MPDIHIKVEYFPDNLEPSIEEGFYYIPNDNRDWRKILRTLINLNPLDRIIATAEIYADEKRFTEGVKNPHMRAFYEYGFGIYGYNYDKWSKLED